MSFDKDNMLNEAIINFKDIKSKKVTEAVESEVVLIQQTSSVAINPADPSSLDDKKKLMTMKLDSAKLYGNREINQFKDAVNEFIEKIDKMSLFDDVSLIAKKLFLEQILEGFIEPTFKGQCPYGIPEDMFKKMRADMFKVLIKKYVDGEVKK